LRGQLALLAKPGRPVGMPSSYRPLCLLDDVGKIFDFLLVVRIDAHMAATGAGLSDRQFGFRSGRSADDALRLLQQRLLTAQNAHRTCVGREPQHPERVQHHRVGSRASGVGTFLGFKNYERNLYCIIIIIIIIANSKNKSFTSMVDRIFE